MSHMKGQLFGKMQKEFAITSLRDLKMPRVSTPGPPIDEKLSYAKTASKARLTLSKLQDSNKSEKPQNMIYLKSISTSQSIKLLDSRAFMLPSPLGGSSDTKMKAHEAPQSIKPPKVPSAVQNSKPPKPIKVHNKITDYQSRKNTTPSSLNDKFNIAYKTRIQKVQANAVKEYLQDLDADELPSQVKQNIVQGMDYIHKFHTYTDQEVKIEESDLSERDMKVRNLIIGKVRPKLKIKKFKQSIEKSNNAAPQPLSSLRMINIVTK